MLKEHAFRRVVFQSGLRERRKDDGLQFQNDARIRPIRRARIVIWNGKDLPPEFRELPAGRYVVEAVEDEAPTLTAEEEAGIEGALESCRRGRVVDAKRAREILDAALGR